MKTHTFTCDIMAYAVEQYINTEKFVELDNHNQFDKIKIHYDLLRYKAMYKEFSGIDMVV